METGFYGEIISGMDIIYEPNSNLILTWQAQTFKVFLKLVNLLTYFDNTIIALRAGYSTVP
ncbi:hypothetical protein TRIP_B40436 [uncultured Desulfatiglans sp.]|uniref:Uncharacterized protein n=1 Tax=Uncultured Desulfatiglans sp. TaxID=1748965 RepID=A0A653AF24_UNCDX|nr:hypothetical protein TRIP_B40436 [uncultured Desulfatiglans sp.]